MKQKGFDTCVIVPCSPFDHLAFLIGCIIMAGLGANPRLRPCGICGRALSAKANIGTTLSKATPLIFTTLCACFAYQCGVFNLGGEGQFLMGSIVACYVALRSGITGVPAMILCLAAGMAAGGVWGLVPGVLKITRGQNEMIISIMLNYVATLFMGVVYTNWLREGSVPQTMSVPNETKLPVFLGMRFTWAFVIAIVVWPSHLLLPFLHVHRAFQAPGGGHQHDRRRSSTVSR